MTNSYYKFILAAPLIAALGLGSFAALAEPNAVDLPQRIQACVPAEQVARVQAVATAQKSGISYYLMNAYQRNDPVPTDLLVSVNRQAQCSLLLYNPMGDVIPLSRFVPQDVARQLVKVRFNLAIEKAGGKEKFQQQLLNSANQTDSYWAPEEVWAMNQLGIQLPEGIEIVSPDSIKVSPEEVE